MKDTEFLKIDFESLNNKVKNITTEKFIPYNNEISSIIFNSLSQRAFYPQPDHTDQEQ